MTTKATFHWDDPLLLNQQLSEQERMVQRTAEQFAQQHLAPECYKPFVKNTLIPLFSVNLVKPVYLALCYLKRTAAAV